MQCVECGTTLHGDFVPSQCKFCSLPEDQRKFLDLFLRCRGNLRDVERSLGLSYPTVRARLDVLLSNLGYTEESAEHEEPEATGAGDTDRRRTILEDLNAGRMSAEEAVQVLETLE
ncbi:MAG: DUF2089 domain-containing protein [Armatimonadetes bacterium]|nr:DUF2089 domain-containing protein [Armatimonadota bacterium]